MLWRAAAAASLVWARWSVRAALCALAMVVAFSALVGGHAVAAQLASDQVKADLVSARRTVAPGETFTVALRLDVAEGWHTYWRNSGDSGAPTTVSFELPPGWTSGEILWPAPHLAPFGPLMNYGFEGVTLYPIEVTAPANAAPGPITLVAQTEWLVCKDICIPEGGPMSLTVEIAPAGADDPTWAGPLAQAVADAPRRAGGVEARIGADGVLTATGGPLAGGAITRAHFFPYDGTAIDHAAPQSPEAGSEGVTLRLVQSPLGELGAAPLAGVLTFESGGARQAIEIEAAPGAPLSGAAGAPIGAEGGPAAAAAATAGGAGASAAAGLTLPLALGFALLGGLILNVMPCVFPVLSLKALSFATAPTPGAARRAGVLFFAGVMATFLLLGGLLTALQAAGAAVGWGFQLQNPWVIGALALLFFAIGLNLLGVFEVGGSIQNLGGGIGARQDDLGAVGAGALAVIAATPCTAPFMSGALAFAAAQPPGAGLGVFAAMGLGFALPLTAMGFMPALRKALPKPGPWMERLKQLFAFPMFATVVWLAWILAGQAGQSGLLALLSALVAFAFVIWALTRLATWPSRAVAVAAAAAALLGVAALTRPAAATLQAEPWSLERVAALQAEGRPAFVTFTADWCVTCKVNERVAFTDEVARAFEAGGVAYLKADWTARDDVIARELARIGRPGVPAYLFYPGGGAAPQVLPQTFPLTAADVLAAVASAARP